MPYLAPISLPDTRRSAIRRYWAKSWFFRELKIKKAGGARFASTARFACRRSSGPPLATYHEESV